MFGVSNDVASLQRRANAGSGVSVHIRCLCGVDGELQMASALSGLWILHHPRGLKIFTWHASLGGGPPKETSIHIHIDGVFSIHRGVFYESHCGCCLDWTFLSDNIQNFFILGIFIPKCAPIRNTNALGAKCRHTLAHTYPHTRLNTSPFLCQASLVLMLWSCRLLVYWCKLSGRQLSGKQRAWQLCGWWVLSNTALQLIFFHPLISSHLHPFTHPPNERMHSAGLAWLKGLDQDSEGWSSEWTSNSSRAAWPPGAVHPYIFAAYLSGKNSVCYNLVHFKLGWCFGSKSYI